VDFVANGSLVIGSAATAPYEVIIASPSLGVYTLTAVAIDNLGGQGTSAPITVTVVDGPPIMTCPPGVTVECTGNTVAEFAPTATDLCDGPVAVACAPPSGSVFPLGLTTVNCTATDSRGNVGQCSFPVVVVDSTPPTVSCPGDLTVDTLSSNAVVSYTASATDTCGLRDLVCAPPSGSAFNVGVTTVTCTAYDVAGNPAACSFTVTVTSPTQPPECRIVVGPLLKVTPTVTVNEVLACSGGKAKVVLDASLSTGGIEGYLWLVDGVPVGTGLVLTNEMALGTHDVMLVLSYGPGGSLTVSCAEPVSVIDGCEAVEEIVTLLNGMTIERRNKRPFIVSLKDACLYFEKDRCKTGINQLEAFQNKAKWQIGLHNPVEAQQLIDAAQAVIDAFLACGCAPPYAWGQQ
jgi:hypothetical protein